MNVKARQSRRKFIKQTLATTATLGFKRVSGQVATLGSSQIDSSALKQFRAQLKGGLILPTESGYEAARRVLFWNPGTERRPAMVAKCADADDVRYAIEFARKHRLEVAVRGGGQSMMGWGTSDGLVINLAGMNRVTINPAKRTAFIDGGVLSGEVIKAAGRYGLAPALGQCPGVGAAGVTLGGGLGWLSGLYGAACDNLLSARLATADGRIRSVDAESNPDLLWGLRGAGANFGVVTDFECRLYPIGQVTAGNIYYSISEARPILRFFRDFMAEAPDSFQATLDLVPGEGSVSVSLCHSGEAAEAEQLLQSFRRIATPTRDTVKREEFSELANLSTAAKPTLNYSCIAAIYRKELSNDVIDSILDRVSQAPPNTVLGVSHYMHGQVCRVGEDATAFPLRQARGVHIRTSLSWNTPAQARHLMLWANETHRLLRPPSGERIYVNYQTHAGKGSAEAVFGNNYSQLVALKKMYDPSNFFRRNSNVEPAKT